MNQVTTTARGRAIAGQEQSIQNNIAKIEQQRAKPPSALALMAMRLGVSEGNLTSTLKSTVFKNCSDAEFVALVIVANEYKLNPLTKEIYAFSAKGGGIVPLVSIDGWVRIMNEHPAFDGIEFTDIVDDTGKLYAIESVIYRKDRTRPIKVTEYMDECKRGTDPWKQSPNRMLRHRALIQGARYAFGFSGIYNDDDAEVQMIGDPVPARNVTPPRRDETRQQLPAHDDETGELLSDEETAELDRQSFRQMDGAEPEQGRDDTDMGEAHTDQPRTAKTFVDDLIAQAKAATSGAAINQIGMDNADEIEALQDRAPKQYERWIAARDDAWAAVE